MRRAREARRSVRFVAMRARPRALATSAGYSRAHRSCRAWATLDMFSAARDSHGSAANGRCARSRAYVQASNRSRQRRAITARSTAATRRHGSGIFVAATVVRAQAPLKEPTTIRGIYLRTALSPWRLAALSFAFWFWAPAPAWSQTPSPLQEWQYSSGIILERLFEPDVPKWRTVVGAGLEFRPLYEGASAYRGEAGPVINIRYFDLAFFSVGEGLGVNILRGDNYRAGFALGYDLGRRESDDLNHLRGLGDIARAPVFKFFASYVVSKKFPLVMRADVRQIVGGADGVVADVGAYLPLPGSSKKLFMFAGPSFTIADRRYEQKVFGVNAAQALASGYPDYTAHGGANVAGFGFSATRFITQHWLINTDLAVNRLLGSASASPITQRNIQRVVALSMEYSW